MPLNQYQIQVESVSNGIEVTEDHFGANSVGTANFAVEGGPFDAAVSALGITHLRYPGGTLTEEQIDPKTGIWEQLLTSEENFITLPDGQRIQTLHSMLEYAGDNGLTVNLVLPTAFLLEDGETGFRLPNSTAIDTMIQQLGTALRDDPNSAHIGTIEIGNEYYYQGRMTANEYGSLANEISTKLDSELQEIENELKSITGFESPDIAVQSGAGWQQGDNEMILDILSSEAKEVIDAVVLHYYPRTLEGVDRYARHFSELEDWRDDPQLSDVKFYASEWNIQNSDASDNGLLQASSFVAAFEELLLQGIDVASVWGTQYRSMDTRLSTLSSRDTGDERAHRIDTDLTATGEIFSIMQESLIGLRSVDVDTNSYMSSSIVDGETDADGDIHVTDFGSEDRYVSFISNRNLTSEARLELKLAQFFGRDAHVTIRMIHAIDDPSTDSVDESIPEDARAEPDLDFLFTGPLDGAPSTVIVPEGAIVILEIDFGGSGVLLEGQNPISSESFIDYSDALTGSDGNDTILGHEGDDTMRGSEGHDIIYGGSGDDRADGGNHSDFIDGGNGDDFIRGGLGSDALSGSLGKDTVFGGDGNDLLMDEEGENFLDGGSGDDSFFVSGGAATVSGGDGADYLAVSNVSDATFSDFNIEEGDRIDVSSHFDDDALLQEALSEAVSSASADGLVTLNLNGGGAVRFFYQGQSIDDLSGAFITDTDSADFIERTAEVINQMTVDQSSSFASSLTTSQFEFFTDEIHAETFFDSLSPQASAGFLLGLSPDEISSLGERLGEGSFLEILQGLDDASLLQFTSSVSSDQLQELLSGVPNDVIQDWFSGLPFSIQVGFGDAVHGTLLPRPDIDHISEDDDDPSDEESEADPPPEEDDQVDLPVDEDNDNQPEPDDEHDSTEASGDCYVATVAFAGMNHPAVWMLRWYRDNVLRRSEYGRLAVSIYWIVGPIFATRLSRSQFARLASRIVLVFFARLIAWHFGRTVGRQKDHVPWPENRRLSFKVATRKVARRWVSWK